MCAAVVVAAFLFVLYIYIYTYIRMHRWRVLQLLLLLLLLTLSFSVSRLLRLRIRIFEEEKMKHSTTLDDSEVRVAAFDADPLLNDTELQSYIKLVEKGCNRSSGPVRERRFYPERGIERD